MLSRLLTRREQAVIVFLAAALTLGSVTLYIYKIRQAPSEPVIVVPDEVATPDQSDSESVASDEKVVEEVVVSITGAVRVPGVYTLPLGARINELIAEAGGKLTNSDTSNINLAAKLIDGTTLNVPYTSDREDGLVETQFPTSPAYAINQAPGSAAGAQGSTTATTGGLIDLNHASQAQLESLPGIGPKYAQEIIRYRTAQPFRQVDELINVSGIGPKRFETLRGLVTVR